MPNNQFHIYSLGTAYAVEQYYFDGTNWSAQQLPSVTSFNGTIAGFAMGNLQYVYYISQN